jgi:hypothetical protein
MRSVDEKIGGKKSFNCPLKAGSDFSDRFPTIWVENLPVYVFFPDFSWKGKGNLYNFMDLTFCCLN